jgi:hypothetical protein
MAAAKLLQSHSVVAPDALLEISRPSFQLFSLSISTCHRKGCLEMLLQVGALLLSYSVLPCRDAHWCMLNAANDFDVMQCSRMKTRSVREYIFASAQLSCIYREQWPSNQADLDSKVIVEVRRVCLQWWTFSTVYYCTQMLLSCV